MIITNTDINDPIPITKAYYQTLIDEKKAFNNRNLNTHLIASWLDTSLGIMLAVSSDKALYLLEFLQRKGLEKELLRLQARTQSTIAFGRVYMNDAIEKELALYFEGKLQNFTTPICKLGTPFQQKVWQALLQIPYGETRSYLDIAKAIGHEKAFRAVALANGANPLCIVVPCHRVINTNGGLGGYGGGIMQKQKLLALENYTRMI